MPVNKPENATAAPHPPTWKPSLATRCSLGSQGPLAQKTRSENVTKKKTAARKKKTTKNKPRLSADLAKALQGRIPPEVLLEFSLAILEGKSPIFVADKTAERGYRIAYSYGEVPPTLEQRQRAFKVILDMGWGPVTSGIAILTAPSTLDFGGSPTQTRLPGTARAVPPHPGPTRRRGRDRKS